LPPCGTPEAREFAFRNGFAQGIFVKIGVAGGLSGNGRAKKCPDRATHALFICKGYLSQVMLNRWNRGSSFELNA